MMALAPGDAAPDFELLSAEGPLTLRSLRGSRVVLYFYPKDSTPGCTLQACAFRDRFKRLEGHGAVVLGVSKDSIASHEKFIGKFGLPFTLLSDPESAVARAYGAFGEKKLYGKISQGTIRSTFLIDEAGQVAQVWSPVKVAGHVEAVIEALEEQAVPKPRTKPTRRA
jgi:peroxiredoxin Q/BCP